MRLQRLSLAAYLVGIIGILLGCGGQGPKSVTLEPRHVVGMPITRVPNSDRATYLEPEALLIDNNYQVWLVSVAGTMPEPPEEKPFLQVYRSEGKFYVISYGTKSFKLSGDEPGKKYGNYNKLPIEKIVVVQDRKFWKEWAFADAFKEDAFKEGKPLDPTMVARKD